MKRVHTTLSRSVGLLLYMGWITLSCRCQSPPPHDFTTIENPAGGRVIYGPAVAQASASDDIVSMLRMVHEHFGNRPQVGSLMKSRDGNSLAAFFTVTGKKEGDKTITGMVIVATAPNSSPQSAVLLDEAGRFASTEPEILRLLAAAGQSSDSGSTGPASSQPGAPAVQNGIPPMHLASGGDKSASICLPADWTITQVSGGSLTAMGPHSEIVALGYAQMILDPSSSEAHNLARSASFSSLPQAKFPDQASLFKTFTDVLNQLRATRKLQPASFTLISAKKLDPAAGGLRAVEAIYDLDLADGVGPRKGSARLDVYRSGKFPEWLLSVSSSSIPVADVDAEKGTLRVIVQSFQQNQPVISSIESGHGPGPDTIHHDHDHGGYMRGEEPHPHDCAAISGPPPPPAGWPGKIAESFIFDPSASASTAEGSETDSIGKLTEWLVKSHPDLFEIQQMNTLAQDQDY